MLVAELADATALAERLDPESLAAVVHSWAARCAEVLQRHGATAEEAAGDAVVGIFGLRDRHEDDPLRAVRAALELRDATVRAGIASGEVFAVQVPGRGAFARGDPMHVAAALGQAAAGGEVLLGDRTHRLVAHDVRADPLAPLSVRGRRAPVPAWRLLGLAADQPIAPGGSATGSSGANASWVRSEPPSPARSRSARVTG